MNKAAASLLEHHFDTAFAAPDGIKKLRELILTLAMQGKLVEQNPNDPPASELLKEIKAEKLRLVKEGKIKKPKVLPEVKAEEMPYELPQGWEWVRLDDVAEYIQRGKGPRYIENSEVPVISQKCIQWRGFDKSIVRYVDPETLSKYAKERFVRDGDLLWNSTGTGTIGRVNLYRGELGEFDKVVADSHVTVVRLIDINNDFALRFLMSPVIQSTIEDNASGTTNQIELNTSTIKEQCFPLPPLSEQRRIVAKIDQLMARCDELEKLRTEREQMRLSVHTAAIKQLLDAEEQDGHTRAWQFITRHFGELYTVKENVAELRKAILQLAVMGKLVPQNPNDPPASELLKEIEVEKQRLLKEKKIKKLKVLRGIKKENMPYELPQGWAWCQFQDIFISIKYGTSKKCDYNGGSVPVLRIPNISNGSILLNDLKSTDLSAKEKSNLALKKQDILIIRSNGSESLVGRSAVVGQHAIGFSYAGYLMRIRFIKHLSNPNYVHQVFQSPMIRAAIEGPIRTTSGVKNVNSTEISQLKIPLPPLEEQHRIVAKIDHLMVLCDTLEQQIDTATGKQTEMLGAMMAGV